MLNQYHVCWNSRSGEKVSFQSENVWCGLGFHHASPPPTRTLFHYALDAENYIYSAYTTTKLKLGGSSPLVITPSEDVYVFLEKADRMRVLRPQLMSAKHLSGFADCPRHQNFSVSLRPQWVGERRQHTNIKWSKALSEPNKHIE